MDPNDTDLGLALLTVARDAIAGSFGLERTAVPSHPALGETGASFVTLKRNGELRGCIGSLFAERPLGRDVGRNAVAAAFHDPRFDPLTRPELSAISIEVSVLGPQQRLSFVAETELLARLAPGIDGVILEYGGRRATFLPQVWQQLPSRHDFLAELKRKLGVPPDFPAERLNVWRYAVVQWREQPSMAATPPVT